MNQREGRRAGKGLPALGTLVATALAALAVAFLLLGGFATPQRGASTAAVSPPGTPAPVTGTLTPAPGRTATADAILRAIMGGGVPTMRARYG